MNQIRSISFCSVSLSNDSLKGRLKVEKFEFKCNDCETIFEFVL